MKSKPAVITLSPVDSERLAAAEGRNRTAVVTKNNCKRICRFEK
jgi:hypothetical protein